MFVIDNAIVIIFVINIAIVIIFVFFFAIVKGFGLFFKNISKKCSKFIVVIIYMIIDII